METHSPLAGLIVENTSLTNNKKFKEFDGMWSSSLTDSALRGMPDNQSVDYSTRQVPQWIFLMLLQNLSFLTLIMVEELSI